MIIGFFALLFSASAANNVSAEYYTNFNNGRSYIFVEGGVEFSVFPDGQFDFVFLGANQGSNVNVNVNTPGVSINFNSGFNYDAYVQYDDYGAVIQVENVPIFYDEFGRIAQAGNVEIRYNNRRIVRVGGMNIFYNRWGYFSHFTGFVSPFYTTYIYRPWHVFYARPFFNNCIVYDFPYRRWYTPVRYSYAFHRGYFNRGFRNYANARREFHRPGSRIHYRNGRTAVNRNFNPNRRNTAITNGRVDNVRNRNNRAITNNRGDVSRNRNNRAITNNRTRNGELSNSSTVNRGRPTVTNNSSKTRNNSSYRGRPTSNNNNYKSRSSVTQSRPKSNTRNTYKRSTVTKNRNSVTSRSNNQKRTQVTKNRSNNIKRSSGISNRNRSSVNRQNSSRSSKGSSTRGNSRRGRL